ncbi:hypothetical protein NODU109028_16210 [Nocardioides dubius]|uniref:DUF2336 domain-containing protein n=1 Tax=Nocardioides dubius TaxID=317019 RepID=A0ABP4ENV4_9ACTN
MTLTPLAAQLLDAQVAWLLARFSGEEAEAVADDVLDDLMALGEQVRLAELISADDAKAGLRLILEQVPPSTAASTFVAVVAEVVKAGPSESFTLSDLIQREHVEALATEAFGLADVAESFLDQIAESPLVATVASRFLGRVVADVLATNRAVAEKVPGLGSLVSLGSSMAGKVASAADKQFEALLGDTAGRGATFAMRRLNKVVVETLKDPAAQQAALEIFDLYADRPIGRFTAGASAEDLHRVAGLVQDAVIAGAASAPVGSLVDSLVDGFYAVYAETPLTTVVEDLGIGPDDVRGHLHRALPPLLKAAVGSGEVERILRLRLEPFYASPEVASLTR